MSSVDPPPRRDITNVHDSGACDSGARNVADRRDDFLRMFCSGDQILVCRSNDGAMYAVARQRGQLVLQCRQGFRRPAAAPVTLSTASGISPRPRPPLMLDRVS